MEPLHELAARNGVDLARLVASPPPTPAFMAMLNALSRWGGEYVIAPDPAHFDGLGAPRNVVLERISQASRSVSVEYVHPVSMPRAIRLDRGEDRLAEEDEGWDEDRPVELGVEQVDAYGLALEVIRLSSHRYLSRTGLCDLVDQVDALLTEVVSAAIRFTARANQTPGANQLTVRWLRYPDRLVVTFEETREHAHEPISVALQGLCDQHRASVGRDRREGGGTVTWFDLPLPLYRSYGKETRPPFTAQTPGGRS
ncbi:ATP-binding protein [Nocardia sp. CA-128927]|uniref:ATP-binding protein n=1 Tax=Nocardia sp. CA-128927 TaxID=3239975 RepID=UPI003D951A6A